MNLTAWVLAGSVIGWLAFSYLRFNPRRGLPLSIIIGTAGGVVGGALVAPLLGAVPVDPGDLNPLSIFVALVSALGCLTVTDMIYRRFGV